MSRDSVIDAQRITEPDISPEQFAQAVARVFIKRCEIYERALRAIEGNAIRGKVYLHARAALMAGANVGKSIPTSTARRNRIKP